MEYHTCSSPVRMVIVPGAEAALEEYERDILQGHFADPRAAYVALAAARPCDSLRVSAATKDGLRWIDVMRSGRVKPSGSVWWYDYRIRLGIERRDNGLRLAMTEAWVNEKARHFGWATREMVALATPARTLGFSVIEASVLRGRTIWLGESNGYYSWPRLGFDCDLPPKLHDRLPDDLKTCRRLLDVLATSRGREWWRANGITLDCEFDTAPDSRSMRTLRAYVAEKGWQWPETTYTQIPFVQAPDYRSPLGDGTVCDCEKLRPPAESD